MTEWAIGFALGIGCGLITTYVMSNKPGNQLPESRQHHLERRRREIFDRIERLSEIPLLEEDDNYCRSGDRCGMTVKEREAYLTLCREELKQIDSQLLTDN